MGVSFKISKVGRRFRPKPSLELSAPADDSPEQLHLKETSHAPKKKAAVQSRSGDVSGFSHPSTTAEAPAEPEVSFLLNIYSNGYSIGKPSEEAAQLAPFRDAPKVLHPYDRASENLFSAIEAGRLPGVISEDIPWKFVDGAVMCEVRDYRKHTPDQVSPVIKKVCLKMSLENVVKDIPLISDTSWTYGDLMEVESRILKALQPELCLDPTPRLDRLCKNPVSVKLNLSLSSLWRKRLRQMPEVTVKSQNKLSVKKACIKRIPESSEQGSMSEHSIPEQDQNNLENPGRNMLVRSRSQTLQDASNPSISLVPRQQRYQGTGNVRNTQDQGSNSIGVSGASSVGQDMRIPYASDNINPGISLLGKRDNQEGTMSPMSGFNKRARGLPTGIDGVPKQQLGKHMDSLHGTNMNWKNSLLQQQAMMGRSIQYPNASTQRFLPQQLEGAMNQEGGSIQFPASQQSAMRFHVKEEPFGTSKFDGAIKNDMLMTGADTCDLDPRVQTKLPHNAFMRSNFPQASWKNIGQQIENDSRKEEQINRIKSAESHHLSACAPPQSPLSSKSGEFSSGSMGTHFGAVGVAQKDKAAVSSIPAIGGTQSFTSSANDDPMQLRQHQAQMVAKKRTNSLPKTQVMSSVCSPVSVNAMNVPVNINSSSMGTQPLADHAIFDRFSKIERIVARYQLNCKKDKMDELCRRPHSYSQQPLSGCLSNLSTNEEYKDDNKPLSRSIIGGSINNCKTRVMNFVRMERIMQGTVSSLVPRIRTRLVLSEKLDGNVVWHLGDIYDGDIFVADDYLSTLPNTHVADLLAAEYRSLMLREGYIMEEHIQAKPNHVDAVASSSQQNSAGAFPRSNLTNEMQQYGVAVAGQATGEVAKPGIPGNAPIYTSHNTLGNTRMLPPTNSQALQMSQGLFSGVSMPMRPQQLDPQQASLLSSQPQQQNQHSMFQQQQQQHPQMQRSSKMLPTNPPLTANSMGQSSAMQPGGQIGNKPSPLQLQMLQQQQQAQMQRKILMGLGSDVGMSMRSMSNSIATGLGMGNSMGMIGRGIEGSGISSQMPSVSVIGNMDQNLLNLNPTSNLNAISQQHRSEVLTPAQAGVMAKLRMGMTNPGGVMGGTQASITGMPGTRQMHPGSAGFSMLGQNPLNRANMSSMQRAAMGPPKLMPGMNLYMNQQQMQHPQLQQHSKHQPQQQHPQQQLQQSMSHPPQQQQLQQSMSHPPQQQQHQLRQSMSHPPQQLSQPHCQLPQQQQQQLQQQHQLPQPQQPQQQQQQLSQPQQQQQQQDIQSVVSPPQVGSPSLGIPQQQQLQQQSPQIMNQRTPLSPQISSGMMNPMSTGNLEVCPASPQLSTQTQGSVGSITDSPFELQAAKNNSSGNS